MWCGWHHLRQKHCLCAAAYTACALSIRDGGLRGVQGMQRVQARGTHRDERILAARLDRDATRVVELGDSAVAVEEATGAAAGEGGGCPVGDVDTANAVIVIVLRCIMGGHTEEELNRNGLATQCVVETGAQPLYAVCEAGVPSAGWRHAGVWGRPTHRDEREGAARVDRDAPGVVEPGTVSIAATGTVERAKDAAAGEGGGIPVGDVDTADAIVLPVLRCIMGQHTEEMLVNRRSGRTGNRCGPYAVCEAGVPSAGWRDAGVRGRSMHRDEREGAARVDRDATRVVELAAADERGGCPGGDVDTANEMIVTVLRCIMCGRTHTERKSS